MKKTFLRFLLTLGSVVFYCFIIFPVHSQTITNAEVKRDSGEATALIDSSNINAVMENGMTPLAYAITERKHDIVKLLILNGADVNLRSKNNLPLVMAISRDFPLEIIQMLIEKGADVNAIAKYRGKPLDVAYDIGNEQIINFLKSKGAEYTSLELETKKLSNDLLRITFLWGLRNNLIVCSGKDGQIIIDAGFNKRLKEGIQKSIQDNFSKENLRYVINTHSHWDHITCNNLVSSSDAVIGLKKIEDGKFTGLISKTNKEWKGNSGKSFPVPYLLKLNNQEIFIFPYPGLHSEEDIIIYFPKSKIMCLGDLLLSGSCPALDKVPGYMEFLEKVIDVFPSDCIFISGHGKDLTYHGLKKYYNDLNAMITIVKSEYRRSKKANEMISKDILKSYKDEYSFLDWIGPDSWINAIVKNLDTGELK